MLQLRVKKLFAALSFFLGLISARNYLNEGMLIGDACHHVFKVWFLRAYSFERWCPLINCGVPLSKFYSPFFYYFSAIISIIFNINVLLVIKLIIFLSYGFASLSIYFLIIKLTKKLFCFFY